MAPSRPTAWRPRPQPLGVAPAMQHGEPRPVPPRPRSRWLVERAPIPPGAPDPRRPAAILFAARGAATPYRQFLRRPVLFQGDSTGRRPCLVGSTLRSGCPVMRGERARKGRRLTGAANRRRLPPDGVASAKGASGCASKTGRSTSRGCSVQETTVPSDASRPRQLISDSSSRSRTDPPWLAQPHWSGQPH